MFRLPLSTSALIFDSFTDKPNPTKPFLFKNLHWIIAADIYSCCCKALIFLWEKDCLSCSCFLVQSSLHSLLPSIHLLDCQFLDFQLLENVTKILIRILFAEASLSLETWNPLEAGLSIHCVVDFRICDFFPEWLSEYEVSLVLLGLLCQLLASKRIKHLGILRALQLSFRLLTVEFHYDTTWRCQIYSEHPSQSQGKCLAR